MQAAKSFIIICFLGLVVIQSRSQSLSGKYVSEDDLSSVEFDFKKNHTFHSTSTDAFEHLPSYKQGYYILQEDTLILFCDRKNTINVQSNFHVVEKTNQSHLFGSVKDIPKDRMTIGLLIQDEKGQPIKGVTIACKNGDDVVFAAISDEDGMSQLFSEGRFIESILLSFVGYEELKIDVSPFWGHKSTIKVQLNEAPKVNYISECFEKYLVTKNTESELHLIRIDDLENKIILMKQ